MKYNDIKAIRIFMECLDFVYCILEKYEDMKNKIINIYLKTSKPQSDTTCPANRLM